MQLKNKSTLDIALQELNLIDDIEKRIEKFEKWSDSSYSGDYIGKRAFKQEGLMGKGIFSINAMKNTLIQSNAFANWCKETYGVTKLIHITGEMAQDFIRFKQVEGCKDATIKTYIASIKKLSFGIQERFNGGNFLEGYNLHALRLKEEYNYSRTWSNLDVNRILEYSKENNLKYSLVLDVLLSFGLREHEVERLKGSDFILSDTPHLITHPKFGTLDIANTLHVRQGKGGLERYVTISMNPELAKQLSSEFSNNKIFPNLEHSNLIRSIHRIADKLGLEHSGTHEFRKTFASELYKAKIEQGMDEKAAREYAVFNLGHSGSRAHLQKIYIDSGLDES